jgi:PBSX family phage portal protein
MAPKAAKTKSTEQVTTQKSASANQNAMRAVRARVIELSDFARDAGGNVVKVEKANAQGDSDADPGASTLEANDPFQSLTEQGRLIEPPFDMITLAMLTEHSSELGQCIEAMTINIAGTGHRFIPRVRKGNNDEELPPDGKKAVTDAAQERADLINFFNNCTDESFITFRRKLTTDLEGTGNAYFEVVRNSKDKISGFYHVPSYQMRLGKMDSDPILVSRKVPLIQADGTYRISEIKDWRRFRVYAQSRAVTSRAYQLREKKGIRWFKEFGDVRELNRETGEFGTPTKPVPKGKGAREMVHLSIYSSRTAYGLPRYIGNLLSIFGDRAAEEINFMTFKNNNIPSMIISVSNGQMTDGTIKRIESFVESQIQKSNNYSKFLIIEAEPFGEEDGEDGGNVKIDVKPLVGNQIGDALFQNYSANNQDKIRRAFRLPPILVGISADMNRAVADTARRLADEQVFAPERNEFDAIMNRKILPDMGILYHEYRSNTPNTTDNAQLVRILGGSEKTGGMTPDIARAVLEDILGKDLPPFPKGFKGDVPFSLTMAEAVKNQADASEPGQQVTAVKILKAMGILGADDMDDDDETAETLDSTVSKITKLHAAAEILWRSKVGAGS